MKGDRLFTWIFIVMTIAFVALVVIIAVGAEDR